MKLTTRILNHMVTWSTIFLIASNASKSSMELLIFSIISGVLAVLGCVARLKMTNLLWFIASHFLAVFVVVFGVGYQYGNLVFTFFLILPIVWSALLSLHPALEWLEEPRGIYLGVCIVVYVLSIIYFMPSYIGTWCVIATVFLYLNKMIFEKFEAADKFVDFGTLSSKIDTLSVKSLCKKMILIYIGMLTVVLTVLGCIGTGGLFPFLGKMLYRIMRFIGQFLPEGTMPVEPEKQDPLPEKKEEENIFEEMARENAAMRTIGKIIFWIIGIATAIILIFVIAVVISEMIERFGKKKAVKEERLIREKLYVGKEKKPLQKARGFQRPNLSAAKKVRKIYKRNLTKQEDKYLRRFPYQNPDEQLETLTEHLPEEKRREEIREIYERARYSEEAVTEADVKRIHHLM